MHLVMELRNPLANFLFKSIDFDVTVLQENYLSNLLVLAPELVVFSG
jgi:hypothetical protein